MALVADEGLAFFAGLKTTPKKSYLSEYSSRIAHPMTTQLLAVWQEQVRGDRLCPGRSSISTFTPSRTTGIIQ